MWFFLISFSGMGHSPLMSIWTYVNLIISLSLQCPNISSPLSPLLLAHGMVSFNFVSIRYSSAMMCVKVYSSLRHCTWWPGKPLSVLCLKKVNFDWGQGLPFWFCFRTLVAHVQFTKIRSLFNKEVSLFMPSQAPNLWHSLLTLSNTDYLEWYHGGKLRDSLTFKGIQF